MWNFQKQGKVHLLIKYVNTRSLRKTRLSSPDIIKPIRPFCQKFYRKHGKPDSQTVPELNQKTSGPIGLIRKFVLDNSTLKLKPHFSME